MQSLIRAVQDELAHQRKRLLIPAAELLGDDSAHQATRVMPEDAGRQQRRGPRLSSRQKEIRQQQRQQKVALFDMVKGMQAQGMRAFEIVKATGISRGRVDKWLAVGRVPAAGKDGTTAWNGGIIPRRTAAALGSRVPKRKATVCGNAPAWLYRDVWSAAGLQAETSDGCLVCANVFGLSRDHRSLAMMDSARSLPY